MAALLYSALFLAACNQVFSLFAPLITGNVMELFVTHPHHFDTKKLFPRTQHEYFFGKDAYHGLAIFSAR